MFDSPGDDSFVGKSDYAELSAPASTTGPRASTASMPTRRRRHRRGQAVRLVGQRQVLRSPAEASLYRPGFYNRAKGFEGVHAYASNGGIDEADLYDSKGNDTYDSTATEAALFGTGFYNRAKYFDEVYGDVGSDAYRTVQEIRQGQILRHARRRYVHTV